MRGMAAADAAVARRPRPRTLGAWLEQERVFRWIPLLRSSS